MNRLQFIKTTRKLLTSMELDHEDCTGVGGGEELDYATWLQELEAAQENTIDQA